MSTKYFFVEPEVAGGMGPHTVMDRSVHPPRVSHLHYEFEGWLGDEIVATFPCWIVTVSLAEKLRAAGLTGMSFDPVEISYSELFQERHPRREMPEFLRLLVTGVPMQDDFAVGEKARLMVSERALAVLQSTKPRDLVVTLVGANS